MVSFAGARGYNSREKSLLNPIKARGRERRYQKRPGCQNSDAILFASLETFRIWCLRSLSCQFPYLNPFCFLDSLFTFELCINSHQINSQQCTDRNDVDETTSLSKRSGVDRQCSPRPYWNARKSRLRIQGF